MGRKPLLALTVLGMGLVFTGCQSTKPNSTPYKAQPTFPRNDPGTVGRQDNGPAGAPGTTPTGTAPGGAAQPLSAGRTNPTPGTGGPGFSVPEGPVPVERPAPTGPTTSSRLDTPAP